MPNERQVGGDEAMVAERGLVVDADAAGNETFDDDVVKRRTGVIASGKSEQIAHNTMIGHVVAGLKERVVFSGIADVPVSAEYDVRIGLEGFDDLLDLDSTIFRPMLALIPIEMGGDELHFFAADEDISRAVVARLGGLGKADSRGYAGSEAVGEDGKNENRPRHKGVERSVFCRRWGHVSHKACNR